MKRELGNKKKCSLTNSVVAFSVFLKKGMVKTSGERELTTFAVVFSCVVAFLLLHAVTINVGMVAIRYFETL